MRPKVVILILTAAFGILGIVALFKGLAARNVSTGGGQQETTAQTPGSTNSAVDNGQMPAGSGSNQAVVMSDEMREAIINREIDRIHDLQAQVDGTNNQMIINALIDQLSQSEAPVRKAALEALKELDDTNAVPGLQRAIANTPDPREKVAMMDAIDYLKMPNINDNIPPELVTNHNMNAVDTNVHFNAHFLIGNKRLAMLTNGVAPPIDPTTGQ
jgi:hypothetical protein